MCTLNCCVNENSHSRCRVPLIEICDSANRIKLDLGACGVCSVAPVALLIERTGCPEYEVICETPDPAPCCGVLTDYPNDYYSRRVVEIPKRSVTYPLHEIDANGLSVFVLDDKLKLLGYGRLHATILLDDIVDTFLKPRYKRTDLVFDIDYVEYKASIGSIIVDTDKDVGDNC